MRSFGNKWRRLWEGRYGMDEVSAAVGLVYVVLLLANVFIRSYSLAILSLVLVGWMLFRCFSGNRCQRQKENQVFLRGMGRVRDWFRLQKNRLRDRKTHVYRHCPHCHATLRLKKEKGQHTVCCPRCAHRFEIKVL